MAAQMITVTEIRGVLLGVKSWHYYVAYCLGNISWVHEDMSLLYNAWELVIFSSG